MVGVTVSVVPETAMKVGKVPAGVSMSALVQVKEQGLELAQTLISGEAVVEGVFTAASGIVTVLPDTAATATARVAGAPGLSQVIRLQSQTAAVTVTARIYWIPG